MAAGPACTGHSAGRQKRHPKAVESRKNIDIPGPGCYPGIRNAQRNNNARSMPCETQIPMHTGQTRRGGTV